MSHLVAVTGATGFIGRHLVPTLIRRGCDVRILARDPRRLPPPLRHPAVSTVTGDLADGAALSRLVAGADAVIHLVGIIVERGTGTFSAVHVAGTRAVLEAARAAGCRRFIHMSALGARPDPTATRYHRTKWEAEELVRGSGLGAAILRPAFITGPENAPLRILARLHRFSPAVPIFGDGAFPMQPVWVGDVVSAFAGALERTTLTGTWEIAGPDTVTYAQLVRAVGAAIGHPRPIVRVPLGAVRAAAKIFDLAPALAPITSEQLQMLVEGSATRENAIQRVFGIEPVGFEEGVRRALVAGPAGS
ncbi:MAG TPA: complex I NDUFA9 subunit family protein [Gemmatimonadales bacterium]|nr:complex I NDUFA9 subunit family protein [Gemmatimonadales bacterium]